MLCLVACSASLQLAVQVAVVDRVAAKAVGVASCHARQDAAAKVAVVVEMMTSCRKRADAMLGALDG